MTGDCLPVTLGGALAFAEAILGAGVVLPGEVMVTGIATSIDPDALTALWVAVTLGATLGDHLNYWLGRILGPRLSGSRLVEKIGRQHWARAVDMVRRRGAWAIVISRLLPVVRTLMPAVAGVSVMPYRRFALASLAGSASWAVIWVMAGDAVRGSLDQPLWLLPVLALAGGGLLLRTLCARSRDRVPRVTGIEPAVWRRK